MARRAAKPTPDVAPAVGDTEVARWFYGGRYAEVIAATFDNDEEIAPVDVSFAVGALTFVDRVDDARACFEVWRSATATLDPRTRAACRFFLGLAAARSGSFQEAHRMLVREAFRDRHDPDPWIRAFVFQGIACQSYFTGRFPGAASHALRALRAAHEARFLYASLLGTDMRGHSLIEMGQLQRGVALLEQAKQLAYRLGLTNNAQAVDIAIAGYTARFVPHDAALNQLETLLRRGAHDAQSQRGALSELAIQRALRGRRSEALEALAAAEADALRGDTRRGKVVGLLARLWVTRWQHGPAACRELVEQAAELVEPGDVAFRAELLGFELLVAGALGNPDRERRAIEQLIALRKSSHHFRAKAALGQFDRTGRSGVFDEDVVTPLLRAVVSHDHTALSRIISLGLLGVVPELLGLLPARRIILIPSEELLLLEDHGDVVVRHRPPRWCPVLLRILASGEATKERIVAGLWGIRKYHPELHDPPVRTTIHRLRAFLNPHGDWIEVSEDGYRTTVPVHLVSNVEVPLSEVAPFWEEGEVPAPIVQRPRELAPTNELALDVKDAVYRRLGELEQATARQLAKSLELSQSTVLRALRALLDERRVDRLGFARATRYRPRRASA